MSWKSLRLLATCMLVMPLGTLCVPTAAFAYDKLPRSGTCGTCTWTVDADNNLVVKPTNGDVGELSEWDERAPWAYSGLEIATARFEGTIKAATCEGMFDNCEKLESIDFSGLDTSSVTDMSLMFGGCSRLASIDPSHIDTSSVTSMSNMFWGCGEYITGGINPLDLFSLDVSHATSMDRMFSDCSQLSNLDMYGWNTSNVTDMADLFKNCSSLVSLDLSTWDTSSVTCMSYMFRGCSSLSSLDSST